jgi:TonB family protein
LSALSLQAQEAPPRISLTVLDGKAANRLALSQPAPEYPPLARLNYIQGQVRMELSVTREGRVGRAHVLSGHPFLAASALAAVRHWTYRPLVGRFGPSAFATFVTMKFMLRTKHLHALPEEPERDLVRQVHPPELVDTPPEVPGADSARLRLLVSDKGRVMDTKLIKGRAPEAQAAMRTAEHWLFRPAHWGALAVPWYVDVDVVVGDASSGQAVAQRDGQ